MLLDITARVDPQHFAVADMQLNRGRSQPSAIRC